MAHKSKKGPGIRKPSLDAGRGDGKGKFFVAIAVVTTLMLVPLAVFLSAQEGSKRPPEPQFEIVFPRDEGRHNESVEFWKIDFMLSDDRGNEIDINVDYYLHESGLQERIVTITDVRNTSGRVFYTRASEGILTVEYGELNLRFESSSGSDTLVSDEFIPFQYNYEGKVLDLSGELYYLNVKMTSVKDPLLLDDEGMFTLTSEGNTFGTIKGYMITRLDVQGSMRFYGNSYSAKGYAWLEHEWGAWAIRDMEEVRLQVGDASEFFLVRFFDPQKGEILKQLSYYSSPGGEVTELMAHEVSFSNMKYWLDPRFFPSSEKCLPSSWTLDSDSTSTHLSFHATVPNQIEKYHWEGSLSISGIIGGIVGDGRGFAVMNHFYLSNPSIVSFYSDDSIPSDLYANISNGIPMDNVTAYYRVNGGPWKTMRMSLVSEDLWKAHISVFPGDQVIAYVEGYDLAGKKVMSEHMEWTVSG